MGRAKRIKAARELKGSEHGKEKEKYQKRVEKYQHKRNVMRYSKSSSAKASSKTNEKAPFHFFKKSLFE